LKDSGLKMVIGYRALNNLTTKNLYPLLRIDDLFDELAGSCVFDSFHLTHGYHQIKISEDDVPKTAFRMPFGHYQFKVLNFGLSNTLATFQRIMNRIFERYLGKFVLVYLDDILVFSKNQEDHFECLCKVFDILHKNKLYAKLTKYQFANEELEYLGHVMEKDGIKVDPKKIKTVVCYADMALLFGRFKMCNDNKSQSIDISKITAELVKGSSSMVRILGANS
jgi:hypothetical protein